MTDFIAPPNADGLVKLTGKITEYKKTRDTASFVFTETDQTKMGVIAIAAAMAGLGGQAIATASNATSMEEQADYVEFTLNGKPVKGWVWRSPFNDGDNVEVAAEWQKDHYEVFGIARPLDKTIALYPHCSRGKITHVKNAVKWWLIGGGGGTVLALLPGFSFKSILVDVSILGSAFFTFVALMTYSLARKWMPFVRLSEKVFKVLGWPNASNVDLVKSSKAQRTEQDPGEFGTFYFRY